MQPLNSIDYVSTQPKKSTTITSGNRAFAIAILGWLLLTACFVFINRNFADQELFETGDFAANSLLVQDAKHLTLWTGHYSRFGFNHPGPAILYALAAGEWLLFDALHIVKSPLAGQIFAAGAYNAFWLAAIALLFFRLLHSTPAAITSWIIFTAVTAYVDHTILTGIWPPHLFYLPFATFTLALMRLIAGKGDAVLILILSCGTLVHGHAAFMAICGFMIFGTLVLNWRQASNNTDQSRIFSKRFFSEYKYALIASSTISALFILPLIIETLRHFPGPLYKYVAYSSGNKHNDIGNALVYVAQYWSFGLIPLLIAMLALFFFRQAKTEANDAIEIQRQAVAILFVSTATILYYAIAGIDDLKMPYLGLFYYSTPAIAIALMLSHLLPLPKQKTTAIIVFILALTGLPFIYRQAAKPADYAPLYTDAKIPAYFQQMQALSANTIALDLDQQSGWGRIWSTLVAVEIYAARHGHPELFCINKNWHILFTEKVHCTNERLHSFPRFFVSTANLSDTLGHSAANWDDIGFYRIVTPILQTGRDYHLSDDKILFATSLLNEGWSPVDGDFVWSDHAIASIALKTDSTDAPTAIVLDVGAYLPRKNSTQTAKVLANGIEIGELEFSETNNRNLRKFALSKITAGTPIMLQFEINNPTSPRENNRGKDHRKLGIALYGFELKK